MSAPLRFLTLAVLGWAGIRAATLGVVPDAEALKAAKARPVPSAIVPTVFPPLEPVQAALPPGTPLQLDAYSVQAPRPRDAAMRVYYYHPAQTGGQPALQPLAASSTAHMPILAEPEPLFYAPIPQLDEWPLSRLASAGMSRRNASPVPTAGGEQPSRSDRLQLSAWALLRGRPGSAALASGGTLGGSQAGARLTYSLDPRLALSLRSYSPVGGVSGGEVAAGVKVTPLASLPLSLTVERRQAIGGSGGRSDFALFAEGGAYQRRLPWNLSLDAYAQAGVVGLQSRDLFADGGLTVMRPLRGRFSAGFGLWGGAQPGIHRIDAGPRLSMRIRHNMRIDLDWRQRLSGHAEPASGPTVTLAGNF